MYVGTSTICSDENVELSVHSYTDNDDQVFYNDDFIDSLLLFLREPVV